MLRRLLARVVVPRWDRFAAALFGLVWFVALTDLRVLDPLDTDVLAGAADPAYHAIARDFAQWDTWHWPLTRIENYLAPVGTSAVFTDSNPWLVLVTKLVLPRSTPTLQLVGSWLALMFMLQGWCGARLVARVTDDKIVRAIGGALFTTSPALALRLGHEALCAHFVFLLLLETALTPKSDPHGGVRALARIAAVVIFAAGVHPTIFAIAIPLAIVATARHLDRRSPKSVALVLLGVVAGPAFVWIAFGTMSARESTSAAGWGYFSTNLLSLVDPLESSRSMFLPVLPHGPGQYEGIAYLGAGVLLLVVVALVRTARTRPPLRSLLDRWQCALVVAIASTTIFALSARVMLGVHVVLDVSKLYEPLHTVTNAFRSSGRFVWPLHYAVMAAGIFGAAKLRARWPRIVLGVALFVQIVDGHHVDGRAFFTLDARPPPASDAWRLAHGDYSRLVIDPPDIQGGFDRCPDLRNTVGSFLPLARIATREKLVFNSGWAARFAADELARYCEDVARDRREGVFDAQTIYAPEPHVADAYLRSPALTCGRLDARTICVRADRPTAFQRALASTAP